MAGEGLRILVWALRTFLRHGGRGEVKRFAGAHVAGLAAINDVCFRYIDLLDRGLEIAGLLDQSVYGLRRQVYKVVCHVSVHVLLGFAYRLEHLAKLQAKGGLLVVEFVKGFFEFAELVLLTAPVGEDNGYGLALVIIDFFLLAGLAGFALVGFQFVGECIDVSAAVGENRAHGEQPSVDIAELFVDGLGFGGSLRIGLFIGLFQREIVGAVLDIFFGRYRFRALGLEERAVTVLPLTLELFPRTLAPALVPQRPQ